MANTSSTFGLDAFMKAGGNYNFLGKQSENPPAFKGKGFSFSFGLEYIELEAFSISSEVEWTNSTVDYVGDEIHVNSYSFSNQLGYSYNKVKGFAELGVSRVSLNGALRTSLDFSGGAELGITSRSSLGFKVKRYNLNESVYYYDDGPGHNKINSFQFYFKFGF